MPRSDDDEGFPPPKRRSTLGIPVIRGDMPEPLTSAEIKRRLLALRAHAKMLLDDPSTARYEYKIEGCGDNRVSVVRFGADMTASAVELYRDYFRGPAPTALNPRDITHLVAFRRPEWATRDGSVSERQENQILFAFRVHGGKTHYWPAWVFADGGSNALRNKRWHELMRHTIIPETIAFYADARASADSEGRTLTCALCGAAEKTGQRLHVDHAGPAYFATILFEFCRSRGWVREDGSVGVSINCRLAEPGEKRTMELMPIVLETVPPTVAGDFAEYHRGFPKTLRLLCGKCNNNKANKPDAVLERYKVGGRLFASDQYPRPPSPPAQTFVYQGLRLTLLPPSALPPAPPTSEQD